MHDAIVTGEVEAKGLPEPGLSSEGNTHSAKEQMLSAKKRLLSAEKRLLRCSFCGRSEEDSEVLIAGPSVFICEECSDLCISIIDEQGDGGRLSSISELCQLSIRAEAAGLKDGERAALRDKIQSLCNKIRRRRRERAGDTIAGCTLRRVLGAGNFATVWEADYKVSEEDHEQFTVAVKIFDQDKLGIGLMLWRFQRGVRAMKHLTDLGSEAPRSIVRLYGVSDDGLAFSMQYLPNGDLTRIRHLGWSPDKKKAVFLVLAKAVGFAHGQGIVHRDLKPANVVLDDRFRPVLTDFDIADIHFAATQSMSAASLGSPQFAAPEQLAGYDLIANPTADIYSLGKLLFFLLAEEPPPLGSTDGLYVPQYLSRIEDERLRHIIAKSIRHNASERYQSVSGLIEDYQAASSVKNADFSDLESMG